MANSRKRLNLIEHLVAFLNLHSARGRHIALGLSGGMDSCVLLHLLVQTREQLDLQLSAIHVHHGISLNADAWERFCADLCARNHVAFSAVKVNVTRDSGMGLEAAAREVRYQALLQGRSDLLVMAHHQDDQAETLLLQMLRGAGVKGLAAMPVSSQQNILRPLLEVPRSEILQYAQAHGLQWIEDESNADLQHDRNFLRQSILPELAKRFPGYRETLTRTTEHLANAAELLDQVAAEDADLAVDDRTLDIRVLRALSDERAANLLRWWVRKQTGMMVSAARLQNMQRQLCQAKANARIECSLGEVVLRRYRDTAYLDFGKTVQPYVIRWNGETTLDLPDGCHLLFRKSMGEGMALDKIKHPLTVTNQKKGAWQIRIDNKRPTRSLKNLLQEANVPPWERDRMPVIVYQDSLVAIPRIGVAAHWQARTDEYGLVVEFGK